VNAGLAQLAADKPAKKLLDQTPLQEGIDKSDGKGVNARVSQSAADKLDAGAIKETGNTLSSHSVDSEECQEKSGVPKVERKKKQKRVNAKFMATEMETSSELVRAASSMECSVGPLKNSSSGQDSPGNMILDRLIAKFDSTEVDSPVEVVAASSSHQSMEQDVGQSDSMNLEEISSLAVTGREQDKGLSQTAVPENLPSALRNLPLGETGKVKRSRKAHVLVISPRKKGLKERSEEKKEEDFVATGKVDEKDEDVPEKKNENTEDEKSASDHAEEKKDDEDVVSTSGKVQSLIKEVSERENPDELAVPPSDEKENPDEFAEPRSAAPSSPMKSRDPDGTSADELGLSADELTLAGASRQVLSILSRSEDPDANDVQKFVHLVKFSFPFIDGKYPPASQVSLIICEAKDKGISLDVVDRFLDAVQSVVQDEDALGAVPSGDMQWSISGSSSIQPQPSSEKEKIFNFLASLLMHLAAKYGASDESRQEEETESQSVGITAMRLSQEEAVEVDLNEGFVEEDDAPSATDEPWWEVAARVLSGKSRDDGDNERVSNASVGEGSSLYSGGSMTQTDADDFVKHPQPVEKQADTVNDAIDKFWNDRRESKDNTMKMKKKEQDRRKIPGLLSTDTSELPVYPDTSFKENSKSLVKRYTKRRLKIQRRWTYLQEVSGSSFNAGPINAVAATALLEKDVVGGIVGGDCLFTKQWRVPYLLRTGAHPGYFDVDIFSLYDAAAVPGPSHPLDELPWENRSVKQRFLHEQSISFSRNWFGSIAFTEGNDRIHQPVCMPKSMEMPMKAGEWTDEWYQKPWIVQAESTLSDPLGAELAVGRRATSNGDEDELSWEEIPECGKLKNVKLKIGDRITRVTPELTSSLRKSRWRKKHFPHGSFPYK
jgi:hypothetical protein